MVWTVCLVILSVLHISISKECVIDNRSLDSQWEKKLHKDLSKGYVFRKAPSNNTIVDIDIIMKYFVIDEHDGSMTMYCLTLLSWYDQRLVWNPKDYYDIEKIYFWSFEYWLPAVTLMHETEDETLPYYGFSNIRHNGKVVCAPKIESRTSCVSFVRNWPYDTKLCNFNYGQSMFEKENIILTSKFKKTARILGAEYGAEWIITDYSQRFNVSDKIKLRLTFTVERNAEGLGAAIIAPVILLSIFTVVTTFRDVNNFKRFWLTCFSVLCHFYTLMMINDKMPRYGSDIPYILIFCRSSLLMSSVLVTSTLGLKQLRNRSTPPPDWIGSVTGFVFDSHGKYLIWPRWKNKPKVPTSDSINIRDVETWNDFSSILNTVLSVVCLTAYLLLTILYIPRSPPMTF